MDLRGMKRMDNQVKSFGIRRTMNYIWESFVLAGKRAVEYKSNIYSAIPIELIYIVISFFMFSIFTQNFEFIGWTIEDFMLFNTITIISFSIAGFVIWKGTLKDYITEGTLNVLLMKPLNPLLKFNFYDIAPPAFIFLGVDLIFFIIVLFIFDIVLTNIFLGFFIFILITLLTIMYYLFLYSLDFLLLGIAELGISFAFNSQQVFERYPYPFFKDSNIKYFLFLFPNFFTGSLLVPVLVGYDVWNFWFQIFILLLLIFLFTIGTMLIWSYGLKRYEAYG
jgi:ABC-type uncharacterized transport system permease subunit